MWYKNETLYSFPSSNRWPHWINKPNLQDIPMNLLFLSTRWLGWLLSPHGIHILDSSAQQTPFCSNIGFHPEFNITITEQTTNPLATKFTSRLSIIHKELQPKLTHSNEYMSKYYHQHHLTAPKFSVGDKVWLLQRSIKTTQPSDRLDYKKIEPYKILRKHSKASYLLKLPPSLKQLHPVFHVSLLEPVLLHYYTKLYPKSINNRYYLIIWSYKLLQFLTPGKLVDTMNI